MAHFSLRFPNYLKACYRLTTCIHHFQLLMAYIQLERRALLALCYWSAGTDLVVLTFQLLLIRLRNCHFSSFLFYFFLSVSIKFLEVFFVSLPSFTHFPPPPCFRQEGHATICFAPDHSFDYWYVLGLRKKYGLFCGLKDFALIDVSVPVWKL